MVSLNLRAVPKWLLALFLILAFTLDDPAYARPGDHRVQRGPVYRSHHGHAPKRHTIHKPPHRSKARKPAKRSAATRRSPEARSQFMKENSCPSTGKTYGACPGYVVDHKVPLKRGGADAPHNMQWQTARQAKAKDKWE